jgi:hypothetical protein
MYVVWICFLYIWLATQDFSNTVIVEENRADSSEEDATNEITANMKRAPEKKSTKITRQEFTNTLDSSTDRDVPTHYSESGVF